MIGAHQRHRRIDRQTDGQLTTAQTPSVQHRAVKMNNEFVELIELGRALTVAYQLTVS